MNINDLTNQTIFQQSPISTQVFSPTGESVGANKAWEKLWGVKHKQILGYNVLKDKQLIQNGIMSFIERGFQGEIVQVPAIKYEPNKTISGKKAVPFRWVKALIYPVKDHTGKIIHVVLQHEDITEQILSEEKLHDSETRYKTLTGLAPVGIFQTDEKGNCLYVNKRWCDFAGMTHEQAKGQGWLKALHPDDKERIVAEWNESANHDEEFSSEYRFKTRKGGITWLQGNAVGIKDVKGNTIGYLGTISDITEKKQTENKQKKIEHALRESEERLRLALNAGNIGVWDWDIVNNNISWSEKIYEIHGVKKDDFKGTVDEFMQVIYPGDKQFVMDHLESALQNKKPYQLEFRAYGPGKKVIWIITSAQVLFDDEDKPIRMLGATIDITERKRLENQKDEFIGLASHELKTPVTSIKVFAQVLQRTFSKTGDNKSVLLLKKMDVQINKLTTLIGDLLDVTRIKEGKLTFRNDYFNFNEMVEEITEEIQRTSDTHTIVLHLDVTKKVYGDRDRYGQVLTNLLTNALKYSPADKNIIVTTKAGKKEMLLSVTDFGIGVPEEKQKEIFQRFFRVNQEKDTYPGLGLGLYICKEIIERQGGEIWVESDRSGKTGTTFSFTAPIAKRNI